MVRLILIIFISLSINAAEIVNTGAMANYQSAKGGEFMRIKNTTGKRSNCFIGHFSFTLNPAEWSQLMPKSKYYGCK